MRNKGEWSELYAFFKLLAGGRLYSGDGDMNKRTDIYYPILEIFRNDAPNRTAYKVQTAKRSILVAGESMQIEVPQSRFAEESQRLLEQIRLLATVPTSNLLPNS